MGKCASLAFAGTLSNYRDMGAQSLLLQTRLYAARNSGCDYIMVETGEPLNNKPVASYRNMLRFGFHEMYKRPNWIYTF